MLDDLKAPQGKHERPYPWTQYLAQEDPLCALNTDHETAKQFHNLPFSDKENLTKHCNPCIHEANGPRLTLSLPDHAAPGATAMLRGASSTAGSDIMGMSRDAGNDYISTGAMEA